MWLYGSGFPKSMNIGLAIDKRNGVESKVVGKGKSGAKETHTNSLNLVKNPFGGEYEIKEAQNDWNGWGTCLKPAYEPIIVARKPFKGSLVDNIIENGVGGINIDACRIPFKNDTWKPQKSGKTSRAFQSEETTTAGGMCEANENGRFPSNVILTYNEEDKEEVCGGMPVGGKNGSITKRYDMNNIVYGKYGKCNTWNAYNDQGSASRYFYCAKASKKDRDEGLDIFNYDITNDGRKKPLDNPFQRGLTPRKNTHPTVKPTELMQYLVRLVSPKRATILDPFMGSGSTGKALMYENKERNSNYKFIGIELTEEYLPIAKARIDYVIKDQDGQITFDSIIGGKNEV